MIYIRCQCHSFFGEDRGFSSAEPSVEILMINLKNLCLYKVIAGGLHTCAILVDNSTKCWGWGFYGQLGRGAPDNIGDEPNELLGVFETSPL